MRRIILAFIVVIIVFKSVSASQIYFDDGKSHLINSISSQYDTFWLDKNTVNNPGTNLELVNGGKAAIILPFNKSTITINGGVVNGGNVSIDTHGDNIVTMNSGTLIGDIAANNNSRIFINGGSLNDDLYAYDTGIAEVRGGSIAGILGTFDSGKIYLYGSNFRVNGQSVSIGQSLRNSVPISPTYPGYYIGNITGTLQNGSSLNTDFWISAYADGDVVVVPEPATLLLLGLGGLMLRKKN